MKKWLGLGGRLVRAWGFLLFADCLFGALPAGVQWEIRTGGVDTNGGGFVSGASGTDRSQADAAFCTAADFSTVGTAVTSVLCPFSAASVGNLIQITAGGCTAGFYQVVSVAVVTATLDRSAGTSTLCTAALGGGLLTVANPMAATVTGNTIWIKSGTYTQTTTTTVPALNDIGAGPLALIGYQTTHGDGGTKPLLTTATNSTTLFQHAGGTGFAYINLSFSNTAGTRLRGIEATASTTLNVSIQSCVFDGFTVGVYGDFAVVFTFQALKIYNSEFKNMQSHGATNSGSTHLVGNYFHNNTGDGFNSTRADQVGVMFASNNVFYLNANGIADLATAQNSHSYTLINNDFSDNAAVGFTWQTDRDLNVILSGNIFYNNGTYGVSFAHTSPNSIVNRNNAYGANGTAAQLNLSAGAGDVTLTADPWVARTAANYALNTTAGGGATLKAAGYPGVSLAGTGYVDIGALQSQCAATSNTGACKIR